MKILYLSVCLLWGKARWEVVTAKRLGYHFIDVDILIQEKEGKLLKEIIREQGISGFLEVEDRINAELEADHAVIAPGGSVVYCENAMNHYKEIGDSRIFAGFFRDNK